MLTPKKHRKRPWSFPKNRNNEQDPDCTNVQSGSMLMAERLLQ